MPMMTKTLGSETTARGSPNTTCCQNNAGILDHAASAQSPGSCRQSGLVLVSRPKGRRCVQQRFQADGPQAGGRSSCYGLEDHHRAQSLGDMTPSVTERRHYAFPSDSAGFGVVCLVTWRRLCTENAVPSITMPNSIPIPSLRAVLNDTFTGCLSPSWRAISDRRHRRCGTGVATILGGGCHAPWHTVRRQTDRPRRG